MDKREHFPAGESEISPGTKPEEGIGKEPPPEKTIGAVLRDERKKKRLSYAQVSEITRLRPSILEALEEESWEDLPSPVFAKGFIRSYGRALGLEEKWLSTLYQESDPVKIAAPRPLSEPAKGKKVSPLFMVLILLALLSSYYLWKGYTTQKQALFVPDRITPSKSTTVSRTDTPKPPESLGSGLSKEQDRITPAPEPTHGPALVVQTESFFEEEKTHESDLNSPAAAIANDGPELTLTADIREKTWVKIFIDDNAPKEFMFNPGRHYEWKAEMGFELMIGNAAGIDLELNGKAVSKPSTPGRVVRLTLPKDYKRTNFQ